MISFLALFRAISGTMLCVEIAIERIICRLVEFYPFEKYPFKCFKRFGVSQSSDSSKFNNSLFICIVMGPCLNSVHILHRKRKYYTVSMMAEFFVVFRP